MAAILANGHYWASNFALLTSAFGRSATVDCNRAIDGRFVTLTCRLRASACGQSNDGSESAQCGYSGRFILRSIAAKRRSARILPRNRSVLTNDNPASC